MTVSKTKAKLVDVARQLFAKMGVENTTMNDIALTSKKGRRTLYTYFKSKEDIYMAVVESCAFAPDGPHLQIQRPPESGRCLPPGYSPERFFPTAHTVPE